jgi:hypothetical protein
LKGLKSLSRQLQADYRDFRRAGKTVVAHCGMFHSERYNNEPMYLAVLSDLCVPRLRECFHTSKLRTVENVSRDTKVPTHRKRKMILKCVLENAV